MIPLRYLILLMLLTASSSQAVPPTLGPLAKAYADKHGLPVRVVKRDLGTREIERHFVPVLPTTHDDFIANFQTGNGAVIWRTNQTDKTHGLVSMKPGSMISHSNRNGPTPEYGNVMGHENGGTYLTLALSQEQIGHFEQFLDRHIAAAGTVRDGHGRSHTPWAGQAAFGRENNGTVHGGCMWWFVHAQVAPNLNLATAMGVRRAKGAEVLGPRFIHSGNEHVGPIGIAVPSLEVFNKMTDDELLGPEPAGGAAEQVKIL